MEEKSFIQIIPFDPREYIKDGIVQRYEYLLFGDPILTELFSDQLRVLLFAKGKSKLVFIFVKYILKLRVYFSGIFVCGFLSPLYYRKSRLKHGHSENICWLKSNLTWRPKIIKQVFTER